ncbi:RES domain-containing protein [Fodinibius roseus]|uniref:RES domain-containing protein n=1 Tax=Fodinibius roseus TaxID=1194090 RepID=A0A1M5DEF2_9BACT|nr:RES family NAD+ phosphorylase [Fodinibius roseus]SHF65306.1 RES domain-containing protein [Fodinibius roseus]
MEVFRITKSSYSRDLNGEGARRHGGRWNAVGTPMLYTSEHESLAALEVLAHISLASAPDDLALVAIHIPNPGKPRIIRPEQLPDHWRSYPASDELAEMGTQWIQSQDSLLLKVPSVLIPSEWNILINPGHPDFDTIDIREVRPFQFDDRLRN